MLVLAKTSYYLWESGTLVSASDVMPTDRWLNIWCIWHTYLETLQEFEVVIGLVELCRISGRCVCHVLYCSAWKQRCRGAKPPHERRKPLFSNCDGECLSGSTKRCIFKSMWNIWHLQHRLFKIRLRVSHNRSLIVATFPRPETWRWTKRTVTWLFDMSVKGLMGGPWPMKAAIYSRPSAVSLKVWLGETRWHFVCEFALIDRLTLFRHR